MTDSPNACVQDALWLMWSLAVIVGCLWFLWKRRRQ